MVSQQRAEERAKDMFVFFAMKQNLPNRMAVGEVSEFERVYQRQDEIQLMTKYKSHRMVE